jgi:hypothetical protein
MLLNEKRYDLWQKADKSGPMAYANGTFAPAVHPVIGRSGEQNHERSKMEAPDNSRHLSAKKHPRSGFRRSFSSLLSFSTKQPRNELATKSPPTATATASPNPNPQRRRRRRRPHPHRRLNPLPPPLTRYPDTVRLPPPDDGDWRGAGQGAAALPAARRRAAEARAPRRILL